MLLPSWRFLPHPKETIAVMLISIIAGTTNNGGIHPLTADHFLASEFPVVFMKQISVNWAFVISAVFGRLARSFMIGWRRSRTFMGILYYMPLNTDIRCHNTFPKSVGFYSTPTDLEGTSDAKERLPKPKLWELNSAPAHLEDVHDSLFQ
ncbi:hypothetical protein DEU56DRAFT_907531 [Suillus clintonianus]|uniref:uncharacterized protein n=1 Tax=Suillus clintonianus TaxID=1904413 RepID=UPI001B87192A|nr:uncharacterized protein DEU56DRAFT_907531 [Suillus clintonianus]KAG2154074.1 hypothetical protein DEU56DRAFT_907531 [Suillus clintonianus]